MSKKRQGRGMGVDLFVGAPDDPQPNWRADDHAGDDEDDDDPSPIAPGILRDILGFDPLEEFDEEDHAQDKDEGGDPNEDE